MALADHHPVLPVAQPRPGAAPGRAAPDERSARRALRGQIARLERELGDTLAAAFPIAALDVRVPATVASGPRLLGLGELEALRDALAERLAGARAEAARLGEVQARNRALLEEMLLEPGRHKFARLPNRALGEAGCGVWEVRPRLGPIGMLMGWWHVKLSSGCPLAGA